MSLTLEGKAFLLAGGRPRAPCVHVAASLGEYRAGRIGRRMGRRMGRDPETLLKGRLRHRCGWIGASHERLSDGPPCRCLCGGRMKAEALQPTVSPSSVLGLFELHSLNANGCSKPGGVDLLAKLSGCPIDTK